MIRRRRALVFDLGLALCLLLFAFALARTLRTVRAAGNDPALLSEYERLRDNLEQMEERFLSLTTANQRLVDKREALLDLLANPDNNPELVESWRQTALLAGMSELTGPGLNLVLEDKQNYNPLVDPVEALVHDKTLLHIINLLTDNGAAALSVNGIRLTAVPQIYCIGPTILCNVHRLAPPYEIHVIGDAAVLSGALAADAWLQHLLSPQIGVRLHVTPAEDVYIPSFSERGDYLTHITLLEDSR